MEIELGTFLLRIGAAAVAGILMGMERQAKGKPAGLKTYTLVATGSTVFMLVAMSYFSQDGVDATRIIGQIVVGVGFLGAGVILQREEQYKVRGLATAATIWCSAAAGCLAASGWFVELGVFTVMVVLINLVFGYLNTIVVHDEENASNN